MNLLHPSALRRVTEARLGSRRTEELWNALSIPPALERTAASLTRAELAMALGLQLFDDVCQRVPMARAYVADAVRGGRRLIFDHGALRTVAGACGALPSGRTAFARLLEPLGYRLAGVYPLERLGMTGFVYASAEREDELPQYFVSELHPERFSLPFQDAVRRVVGTSVDPLAEDVRELLTRLEIEGELSLVEAQRLLPGLVACFDRQHAEPRLADYELLAAESSEMAWIATEGNAFNHATDRVENVAAVADEQRRLGRPVKDALEVSRSGRVIQTAFHAAEVERLFVDTDGRLTPRRVPGSFHEFISRARMDDGRLDLAFDANNAQGIFKMTARDESYRPETIAQ